MSDSPQEIIELADALYAAREETCGGVRRSVELLERIANPSDSEAAWRLARALFFLGQQAQQESVARQFHARAVSANKQAVKFSPTRVEICFWHGVNLALLANLENPFTAARHALRAKQFLKRAARINPTYHGAAPLRVLAKLLSKLPRFLGGDVNDAQALFEQAIRLAPANTVTRIYFAQMLLERKDVSGARLQLEALLVAPFDPAWAFEITRDRRIAQELLSTIKHDE